MRITVLLNGMGYPFAVGGAEVFAFRLSQYLASIGHRVRLVQGGPSVKIKHGNLELVYSPRGRLLAWHLAVNAGRPDAALGVSMPSVYPLTLWSIAVGKRFVVRLAGLDLCISLLSEGLEPSGEAVYCAGASRRLRGLKRVSAKIITSMMAWCLERGLCEAVVLGRVMENVFRRVFGAKPHVIPNFVDEPFLKVGSERLARGVRGADGGEHATIVYVGRLTWEKGGDVLVETTRMVLSECEWCRVLVVGDGPYAGTLRRLSEVFAGRVRVTGFVPYTMVPRLLAEGDVFIFPTRVEGCPNALLQAMAAALPIVASRIPPNVEFLGDAGLYARPGDPEDHAEKVLRLVHDERLSLMLARRAYERARRLYSLPRVAEQYLRVLREVA